MSDDEPPEVVASVGPLDAVVVALREFLHRSGALRVVALVDAGADQGPAIVDCGRLRPVEVEVAGRTVLLAHTAELDAEPPELPQVRRMAPFHVDAQSAEIAAPLGAVAHLAGAVAALADVLGARNVAMAQFETSDPDAPLGITARAGGADPLVLSLGEQEFEMDPGWP